VGAGLPTTAPVIWGSKSGRGVLRGRTVVLAEGSLGRAPLARQCSRIPGFLEGRPAAQGPTQGPSGPRSCFIRPLAPPAADLPDPADLTTPPRHLATPLLPSTNAISPLHAHHPPTQPPPHPRERYNAALSAGTATGGLPEELKKLERETGAEAIDFTALISK
jgi:hypothetical protein